MVVRKLIKLGLQALLPRYLGDVQVENQEQYDLAVDKIVEGLDLLIDSLKLDVPTVLGLLKRFGIGG